MTKPVQARDEFGVGVWVFPGDPAWTHVRALWLQGVREIVLPRATYQSSVLTVGRIPATLHAWDAANPAMASLIRRYTRLQDCVEWLRRQHGSPGRAATDEVQDAGPPVGTGDDLHAG